MSSQVWWYVARSSGIVAWALLSASVVWGLLLSTKISTTRLAARRLRPAWLLDLHRHLGGLAVIFTAVHLVGIVADSYVTFSWADVLVPMASEWRPGAVALGVVAMYLLVAVEATSLAIRHLPRPVWRWVHRSSFLLYATATWHGIAAGTDAGNGWFRAAAWASVALVVTLSIRLVVVLRAGSAVHRSPSHPPTPHPPTSHPPTRRSMPTSPALPPPPPPPPPPLHAPRRPTAVPLSPGIAPLPGSVSEMAMPPASIPAVPRSPHREPGVVDAPPAVSADDLVGVSPDGPDGGGLAPPRADS